jgi:hypothetical protein
MSWISTVGTFFGTIITIAISFLVYLHGARKDKHQIDIVLLDELRKNEPSRYLVERFFFYLYRCANISYEEIIMLMNHKKPREAIQKFVASRRWSYVFRLTSENGTLGYELCSGFDTRRKRAEKCALSLLGFLVMYSFTIYLGNVFFSILIQTINDSIGDSLNVSGGFERLFTIVVSFFLTAITAVFSVLSVMTFMSTAFSVSNAKKIVRMHNESP